MNLAAISVAALVIAVVVSCFSRINVGVLAIAMAWIVGVFIGGMPAGTIMAGFPSQLFLTLTGVTLLFTLAQCNGTLEQRTRRAVRVCRGNRGAIPIMAPAFRCSSWRSWRATAPTRAASRRSLPPASSSPS
jgi:hypothetical protein